MPAGFAGQTVPAYRPGQSKRRDSESRSDELSRIFGVTQTN